MGEKTEEKKEITSDKNKKEKLKIICVRTGDKYRKDYVLKLFSMCKRYIKIPFDFICYTNSTNDLESMIKSDKKIFIRYKETRKPGWWGKIDIFQEKDPCLFFDLDTIITDDITNFSKQIFKLKKNNIAMIKPWKKKGWASGIMAWNGDFSFIKQEYTPRDRYSFKWDQRYIVSKLKDKKAEVIPVQDFISLSSYRHHCRMNMLFPKGTQVVCFHGRPNPHELKDKWVKEYWI